VVYGLGPTVTGKVSFPLPEAPVQIIQFTLLETPQLIFDVTVIIKEEEQ
jgi:hypothetical protein